MILVGFGRALESGSTGQPVDSARSKRPFSQNAEQRVPLFSFPSAGGRAIGTQDRPRRLCLQVSFCLRQNSLTVEGREMMRTAQMERPIDEIRKAEAAMRELLAAAAELRRQVDLACAQNSEETVELRKAAADLESEVQRIKDSLQQWRQSIQ
jgi:hypothetical protein